MSLALAMIAILAQAAPAASAPPAAAPATSEIPFVDPWTDACTARLLKVDPAEAAPTEAEATKPLYVPGSNPDLAYRQPLLVVQGAGRTLLTLNGRRLADDPGAAAPATPGEVIGRDVLQKGGLPPC